MAIGVPSVRTPPGQFAQVSRVGAAHALLGSTRMRMLIAMMVLGGCAGDGEPRGCPAPSDDFVDDCRTAVDVGDSCDIAANGNALAGSCQCDGSGFWVCNSCPFSWTPLAPADPCTPSSTCEINSWEHGCSCSCTAAGEWACSPDTINSRCPQ